MYNEQYPGAEVIILLLTALLMDVRVLRTGLFISIIALVLALLFREMDWQHADTMVNISIGATALFLILVIIDVIRNDKSRVTKAVWIAAILIPALIIFYFLLKLALLLVLVVGVIYLFRRGRKKF